MRQGGDRREAPNGPPVVMEHDSCGEISRIVPICDHCGEPLDRSVMTPHPGPGAVLGEAPLPIEPRRPGRERDQSFRVPFRASGGDQPVKCGPSGACHSRNAIGVPPGTLRIA